MTKIKWIRNSIKEIWSLMINILRNDKMPNKNFNSEKYGLFMKLIFKQLSFENKFGLEICLI